MYDQQFAKNITTSKARPSSTGTTLDWICLDPHLPYKHCTNGHRHSRFATCTSIAFDFSPQWLHDCPFQRQLDNKWMDPDRLQMEASRRKASQLWSLLRLASACCADMLRGSWQAPHCKQRLEAQQKEKQTQSPFKILFMALTFQRGYTCILSTKTSTVPQTQCSFQQRLTLGVAIFETYP